MRFSPSLLFVAIAVIGVGSSASQAQEAADQAARLEARRDLELAKMELRNYWQIEYPRQQRQLNAAIKLTEAEVRDYRERLRIYRPFNRFSYGQPLLVTLQELRMCLRDAELRLQDLWAERNALARGHSDHWRLLGIQAFEARLRVAELERELEGEENRVEESDADPIAQLPF